MKKQKSELKWIINSTKSFFPHIAAISVLNIALSLLLILLAYIGSNIIDSKSGFISKSLIVAGIIVLQIILQFSVSYLSAYSSGKITIALREHIFSELLKKEYEQIEKNHSGDILNRMTNDVAQTARGAVELIPEICTVLTKIAAGLYAIIKQNYLLAVIVIIVGFLIPLAGRFFSKKYKFLHKEVLRTEGKTRSFYQECLENITVIKSFSGRKTISEKANGLMTDNLKLRIKQRIYSSAINLSLFASFSLGYYAVIIWAVSTGLSYGTIYYLLEIITILRSPLQSVSGILPKYYSMTASAERIMEIDKKKDEPAALPNAETEKLKNEFNYIICSHLSFSYGEKKVLSDCSFKIKKGTLTLFSGESGCGKSTMFKLLLGLYSPDSGELFFDNSQRIDASVRPMFSYVPQGNMIVSGTIKENLTLFNSEIKEEKIIKATKIAEIYDLISSLPDGFETVLTERGGGLSEGQIQRLAVARALLFDAPILLLDESTSALDRDTEIRILNNIKSLTDKTVLFITHHKTDNINPDKILRFENGKITEEKGEK